MQRIGDGKICPTGQVQITEITTVLAVNNRSCDPSSCGESGRSTGNGIDELNCSTCQVSKSPCMKRGGERCKRTEAQRRSIEPCNHGRKTDTACSCSREVEGRGEAWYICGVCPWMPCGAARHRGGETDWPNQGYTFQGYERPRP